MLSRQQRAEFDRLGFVRVPGAFSEAAAATMCNRLWEELARKHGIQRADVATWTVELPRHLQALRRGGWFDALASPKLIAILDELLGSGVWARPPHWGEPLVTFPRADREWHVPHQQWHIDWPARGSASPLFGLKLLAFLAPLASRGGGTLLLSGSHLLVERLVARSSPEPGHSSVVRDRLARAHPWIRELVSAPGDGSDRTRRIMGDDVVVEEVPLRVVELTGTTGDVVVFHPWLFHAPAPNCSTTPRLMVSHNVQTPRGVALYVSARQ